MVYLKIVDLCYPKFITEPNAIVEVVGVAEMVVGLKEYGLECLRY